MEITAIKLDDLSSCPVTSQSLQLVVFSTDTGSLPESKTVAFIPSREKTSKSLKTTKAYNCKWESDPVLQTWIERHPNASGKVICRFCQSVIRAHKNDLLEHTRTQKHQRNFMQIVTPEQYNQFIIDLKNETNAIGKKRMSSPNTPTPVVDNPVTADFVQQQSSECHMKPDQVSTSVVGLGTLTNNNAATSILHTGVDSYGTNNTMSLPYPNGNGTGADSCTVMDTLTSPVMTILPPLLTASSATSVSPGSANGNGNSMTVESNCMSGVSTILNLTTNSNVNQSNLEDVDLSDDLWQESEDFISAEADSPSEFVSVILEEQQSPTSSSSTSKNNEASVDSDNLLCHGQESSVIRTSVDGLSTMILSGLSSTNLTSLSMNLSILNGCETTDEICPLNPSHPSNQENETLINNSAILTSAVAESTGDNSINGNGEHETLLLTKPEVSLPFTITDVLAAIEGGHFSFAELCSLAKASTSLIDRCINGAFSNGVTTNGVTLCSTPSTAQNYSCTNLPSLTILSPHGTTSPQPAATTSTPFCLKKDRSLRKRRGQDHQEDQVLPSKINQL